jgi:small-conductance mechanosensitive channel
VAVAAGQAAPPALPAAVRAEPSDQTATLVFFNRPIVVLRARILGRDPPERAETARRALDDLAAQGATTPVEWRPFEGGILITVASRGVVALTAPDIDELAGETLEGIASESTARLQRALDEAAEARAPGRLLRAALLVVTGLGFGILLLWGIRRANLAIGAWLVRKAEERVAQSSIADVDVLRASHVLDVARGLLTVVTFALHLVVLYVVIGFALRQFPYTRPWGESMRGFLLTTFGNLGLALADAVPGLFTAAIIVLIARFLSRLIALWFGAIERERFRPVWIHPETAEPTRRLLTAFVWILAIVVAYPYIPGSQTDAFKGVSVLLGLMVTLGSSGFVNQVMSGFMITYSRALRRGDFVRVGNVEGTVVHLGLLSTKIRTPLREEVTIPNAVVVTQTMTDYSRNDDAGGVFTPTSVTLGYDIPWRQAHALLLMAAERTPGVRREPKPVVLQMSLDDFYVKYTLFVCLERQDARVFTLDALHAQIQDRFNEFGVQIMSPHYLGDPARPKVVPKADWFSAPAPSTDAQSRPRSA